MLRLRRVISCCFVWLPVIPAALSAQTTVSQRAPQAFALTHVNVLNVETGQLSADVTVVVSGNRIAAVGPDARIPNGARIVDARGKVRIPGLWDMHSHSLDR